jgi:hypothetical protein
MSSQSDLKQHIGTRATNSGATVRSQLGASKSQQRLREVQKEIEWTYITLKVELSRRGFDP